MPSRMPLLTGLTADALMFLAPEASGAVTASPTIISIRAGVVAFLQDLTASKRDPAAVLFDALALISCIGGFVAELRVAVLGVRAYNAMLDSIRTLTNGDTLQMLISFLRSQLLAEGYNSADKWSKIRCVLAALLAGEAEGKSPLC